MEQQIAERLQKIVDLPFQDVLAMLEVPPSKEQGDLAFPCFQLARTWRKAPAKIAEEIKAAMDEKDLLALHIKQVETAGPYINFFFDRLAISESVLKQTVTEQLNSHQIGNDQTIVVEYSSPNIAKHFKLYHIRSTMIGQALANVYEALGYTVERMNHLGDWGTQFGKLMAAYVKWGDDSKIKANPITELDKLYVRFHQEAEQHPELEEEGRAWFKRLENGNEEAVRIWKWFVDESLQTFEKIYRKLGVHFDHYIGESHYSNQIQHVIDRLSASGILEESDGALVVRFDEEHLPPCIIQKQDGTTIYATRDIAAALYRGEHFDPQRVLYVVDQRQATHFEQVFSVLEKMGFPYANKYEHVSFGIMKIDGEVGSTRQGKGLLLSDVLDEAVQKAAAIIEQKNPSLENKDEVAEAIGVGAIVFNDLKHHRTHEVDFRWDEAFNFDGKTGPYVQYTHARICSLLKRAGGQRPAPIQHETFQSDVSWQLISLIQEYPTVLREAAAKTDPSQIAKYLLDLCQQFNRFYAAERIFIEDELEQQAKLALCWQTSQRIHHGLNLLSIKAPESI